jgi:hypothetical protein
LGIGDWGLGIGSDFAKATTDRDRLTVIGSDFAKATTDRGRGSVGDEGLAFCGEAVFLEAAVGFFGDGAFDETGFESWDEVEFFKVMPIHQLELRLKFFSRICSVDGH